MNSMIGLLVPALLGVDLGSVATERTANYQPPGSPGGTNSWATPASPTTARWPTAPTNIPTSSPTMTENPRYSSTIPTPVPTTASSSSNLPPSPFPQSNNGYAVQPNPTTVPTPTMAGNGGFPGSSLGTLPSSTVPSSTVPSSTMPSSTMPSSTMPSSSMPGSSNSTTAAWPTTTAPPSLGTGPRVSQPQNWPTAPRESTISARMPAEPNLPTPNLGTIPNYNHYQQPPANNQWQQPQTGWSQQQVAQAGYPPPPSTAGPQFPTNNPNVPPTGYVQNPQQQPQQPQQNPGVNPNLATNPGATIAKEPTSASDKSPTAAKQTDALWVVLTWIFLCTSLACNLYFGWSKYQMQERYRLLLVDRGAYSS